MLAHEILLKLLIMLFPSLSFAVRFSNLSSDNLSSLEQDRHLSYIHMAIHMRCILAFLFFTILVSVCFSQQFSYHSVQQKNEAKFIALTFDDGPHQILTPRLLDILKDKAAKATFFVMGVKAVLHPTILTRMHVEGHEVANHVWDHPVLTKISYEKVHDQLARTNDAIKIATNSVPKVMRPPYGNTNAKLNKYISKEEKLPVIMWSLDTRDWMRPSPDEIVSRVVKKAKSGDIILCHDIHPGTIEAIPRIIDEMHKQGYIFVTVSELIANEETTKTKHMLRG